MAIDVEAVKAATDLVTVVGNVTPLVKRGSEWVGKCVAHSPDNNPSMYVNPRKGLVHCLSGDTGVITRYGTIPIADLAGKRPELLMPDGSWKRCQVKAFGEQHLWRIDMQRNGVKKSIHATDEHRWFVRNRDRDVLTKELRRNHRLNAAFPRERTNWFIDSQGASHGITFGDGTAYKNHSIVLLHGGKSELSPHFIGHAVSIADRFYDGKWCRRVYTRHPEWKQLPNMDNCTDSYLLGFLAGYVATDGCVSENGDVSLASKHRENLIWVRDVCAKLGIWTYTIGVQTRLGYGKDPSEIFKISFVGSSLSPEFFLLPKHRERFASTRATKSHERKRWVVTGVEKTQRVEQVYCAIVPKFHAFAIEGNILTGNCFSCGFSTDLIGFVQHVHGLDFKAACEWLGAKPSLTPALSAPPRVKRPERITSKPPADAESPNMLIRSLGPPSKIWPYRDTDGGILGYVARYDSEEGKEIRCWTWGKVGDAPAGWACGHWNAPRPLYGLDRLAARPTDRVVICEGEKAADAAGRFLPGYVAISWPGGAQSLTKADWSPLAGRTVLLWPDADEPGWKAMQTIAAILADPTGLACTVRILDSNQMAPGWDAADAESEGWSTEELVEWAKPRARDFTPAALQAPVGAAPATPAADSAPTATVVRLAAVDGHTVTAVDGEEARPLALSESGVALEFVTDHCGDLRYVHEWEAWMKWNGHRWTRETNRQTATQRIQNMCKGIKYRPEARELSTSAKNHFERKAFFFSCLDLAEYDRRLIVTPDMFDANPMQLSTPGGTVDLATGKLCAPDPADYITRSTSVAPVQGPHPLFDQVIKCASSGSADMECFIWRWLGYICTGSVREESFLFLFGKPACGKSTLVECIANILGLPQEAGYATKVPIELFTESKHERSGDAHVLHGARFAFCAETEENRHWKAALLKEATGGDTMTGERKYENVFAFRPSHKIWIHGNHKPHMRTADEGLRRRMHLLEYASDIPEGQRDLHFKDKLAAEYPAILYSMIQSAIEWNEFGLRKPQQIIDTVSEYFTDEDTFGSWWDECVTVASGASCGSTDAFKSYQAFCDERGERAPSHKRFSIMVKNKGHEISKSGTKRILGISLVPASFGPPGDHWSQRD